MRKALMVAMALCLTGCSESISPCAAAEKVRVEVRGRSFIFPVELKPSFIGPKGARLALLPSYNDRDGRGRWAYCQRPTDRPAKAESVSFYPRDAGMPEVTFLIIDRDTQFLRPQSPGYPTHAEDGFEVTRTKGITWVFSPAGGVRATPVLAHCAPAKGAALDSCRISFIAQGGADVTFDLDGEQPLSGWADIISDVDAYVADFELTQ
jgi:hypothetical protein